MTTRQATQAWYASLFKRYYSLVKLILVPLFKPIPQDDPLLLREKVKIVPVAIDLETEFALDQKTHHDILPNDLGKGDPLVISIGRLHPDKGHEFAIQAWLQVTKEMPAAKLIIVGEGKDELRLKKLTQTLGLTGQVEFISYLEELATLFHRADIYLRASINEGSNLTIMQAMAAGLAVIGFRNEQTYEIIRHGKNGLLVTPRDAQGLARAIINFSNDKTLRSELGQNARLTINQIYNLQDVISYHQQIYAAAAGGKPLETIKDLRE